MRKDILHDLRYDSSVEEMGISSRYLQNRARRTIVDQAEYITSQKPIKLRHVIEQTEKMVKRAVERNPYVLHHVLPELKTVELYMIACRDKTFFRSLPKEIQYWLSHLQ